MPDDANIFSADIPQLRDGVPKIEHFSELIGDIYGNLNNTLASNPLDTSGDDDFSKSLKQKYDPSKEGCLQFLRDLQQRINDNTNGFGNMGNILSEMDLNSTDVAGGVHGHRH
ncbi:hypothetical protein [Actinoallomurus sp. CA-142502]|uniref:hypothetical protein n=1 Tax=Actinoallomurus sp. CA-142502 TaxID=3239885 RepID=UPI003D9142D8